MDPLSRGKRVLQTSLMQTATLHAQPKCMVEDRPDNANPFFSDSIASHILKDFSLSLFNDVEDWPFSALERTGEKLRINKPKQ